MKQVIVTIDTEGPAGKDPIKHLIYGETKDGKRYGIEFIMNILDLYGVKGLFFVDLAEAWDNGEKDIARVLMDIESSGHNTGVHIHPDHMSDQNRRFLWQYSYGEQKEIIRKCTDLYESILGKKPISFRAGRYGANRDTLHILDELGYKFDMSEFYGNRRCSITPPTHINKACKVELSELIEIPITVFKSFSIPGYSRVDKVDCNMNTNEFKRVMRKIDESSSVSLITYFMHSFSALQWRKNPDLPSLCKKARYKIESQLDWISANNNFCFIQENDLNKIEYVEENRVKEKDEIIDISKDLTSYWFFAERACSMIHDKIVLNV